MRMPPIRLTLRRMMIAVAVVAVLLTIFIEVSVARQRRVQYLNRASWAHWCAARCRRASVLFGKCPTGHLRELTGSKRCQLCSRAWNFWPTYELKDKIVSPTEAVQSLIDVADIFDLRARRLEQAALTPWLEMSPVSPSEAATFLSVYKKAGPGLFRFGWPENEPW